MCYNIRINECLRFCYCGYIRYVYMLNFFNFNPSVRICHGSNFRAMRGSE